MGFYVYITEQCKEDAKKYNLTVSVEKLKERLLSEQRTGSLFDNFPPPYLKKRFERQQRLLAAERYISIGREQHTIVCFYRILIRGGDEYSKGFLCDPLEWGNKYLQPLASEDLLEHWLRDNPPTPAEEKQLPDFFEKRFLWDIMASSSGTDRNAEMIYESPAWINAIKDEKLKRRLINFPDTILDLCTSVNSQESSWKMDDEVSILARVQPEKGRVFLIAPMWSKDYSRIEELQSEYADFLDRNCSFDDEELARKSGRAYPYNLLLNKDLWISAEEDEVANLALSAEEATLLEDVHRYESENHQGTGLPLFINGRAGSGKSTLLQYLYADYLRYYFLSREKGQRKGPLYLTCSPELLQRSRKAISSLVALNPQNVENQRLLEPKEITNTVEANAIEFHTFLYSLLTDEEKEKRFQRITGADPLKEGRSRVDYSIFVRIWEKSFAQNPDFKRYTPELAWHIIRTYIKGMGTDDFLDANDYLELDDREKSVSQETFQGVYDTVWKKYAEECKKKQLWDDQDLARYLLMKERITGEYVAVFCDEAQDFTRIELEIILRLSVFSDRKLAPEEISRVPFVFAGDPFQTLNPTGFRWEAVKATFYQKFIASLDPSRQRGRADINYRELHYNYRSTPNIVRFTNSIQALRYYLFHQSGVQPQIPWQHGDAGDSPCWFNCEANNNLKENIEQNQDVVIIIPCRDGEETSFVENDPYLSQWIPLDESGVPRNVLSAMRAKGLEFDRVALYGFGNQAPDDLLPTSKERHTEKPIPEWILPREYFINRLYVAASRGKKQLFVIDTAKGYERLWGIFEEKKFSAVINSFSSDEQQSWRGNLGEMLLPGTDDSWLQGKGDLRDIASNYEVEGKARKDPYLLRAAAINYENLKDTKQAFLCRALAYKLEGNFEKSGDLYRKVDDSGSALEMYWAGNFYSKIADLATSYPDTQRSLEYRFVDVLQKKNILGVAAIFQNLVDLLQDQKAKLRISKAVIPWKNMVENILELLFAEKNNESIEWAHLFNLTDTLYNFNYASAEKLAFLSFQIGEDEKTLQLLDQAKKPDQNLYRLSKTRLLLKKIETETTFSPSNDDLKLLVQYYRDKKEYVQAASYASVYRGITDIENILVDANRKQLEEPNYKIIFILFNEYVRAAEWTKLVKYLETEIININHVKISWSPTSDTLWSLRKRIVKYLASSNELINAGLENIQTISRVVQEWVQKSECWKHIHPLFIGAVLERVALDIDCLKFYEMLFGERLSFKDDICFASKKRWLICKLRQIKREEEQLKSQKQAQKHKDELIKRKKEWGISHPEREPDFPSLEGFNMDDDVFRTDNRKAEPEKVSVISHDAEDAQNETFSGLTIIYDNKTGRMKIQKGNFDSISIHAGKKNCVSVDVDVIRDGDIYSVEEWNFQCDFSRMANGGFFTISVGNESKDYPYKIG